MFYAKVKKFRRRQTMMISSSSNLNRKLVIMYHFGNSIKKVGCVKYHRIPFKNKQVSSETFFAQFYWYKLSNSRKLYFMKKNCLSIKDNKKKFLSLLMIYIKIIYPIEINLSY